MRASSTTRPPMRYRQAITGTIFSAHAATRWLPPKNTIGGKRCNNDADDPCGNAGRIGKGFPDGIGLHHAADEAQRKDDGYGEEAGQELAEATLKGTLDVINRAAVDAAVRIDYTGLLRQHRFRIDGSHAEEGDDPHPEDGAGTADEDSAAGADDITGTYLRGNGRGQCLEGGKAALLLSAMEIDVAEYPAHTLAKAAHLHKAGTDGEIKTRAHQQDDEDIIREIAVDFLYDVEQCCFHLFHS